MSSVSDNKEIEEYEDVCYLDSDDGEFDAFYSNSGDKSGLVDKQNDTKTLSDNQEYEDIFYLDNDDGEVEVLNSNIRDQSELINQHNYSKCSAYEETEIDYANEEVMLEDEYSPNSTRKKRKRDPLNWKKTLNQKARLNGNQYLGKKKFYNKWKYDIRKQSKSLEPPCNCSKEKKTVKCRVFNEEQRSEIHRKFWKELNTWNEKRLMISILVLRTLPANLRSRHDKTTSRRNVSLRYHLKIDDQILPVCKTMFLTTLGITQKVVYTALIASQTESIKAKAESRRQRLHSNFQKKQKSSSRLFLTKLNKVESHYCRKKTSKLYLEPLWLSVQELYAEYQSFCEDKSMSVQGATTFYETFNDLNLSLFAPKKDQCDICTGHATGNIEETEYQLHIIDKNLAQQERERDTMYEKNVFTMDAQSVLLSPLLKASAAYFRMKLAVHDFTIFHNITKDGACYLWHEGEGGVTANEFASVIGKFINERDTTPGENLIFYSDGCAAQNRNVTMSNALLNMAMQKQITITQKILEKGHTHMECDSMHSTIERRIKKQNIYTPAGYILACLKARKKPLPYHVEYLNHTYFRDHDAVKFFDSIRPGQKKGDPYVRHVKCLMYLSTGVIKYKLHYFEEWEVLPQPRNARVKSVPFSDIPGLYQSSCPITAKKYKHLQELKSVIPHEFHDFYNDLAYK